MATNDLSLSLIVPCYNEEANIQKGVLDKIGNYTLNDSRFNEVIIVDDGSIDNSPAMIKERYLKKFPKFRLIENEHQGKAFTIITGVQNVKSTYAMFSDMDLATPIEEAEKLIAEVHNGFDIVIGSRKSRRDGAPFSRRLLSLGAVIIRSYIIGLHGINDTQCGFKLFKNDVALDIMKRLIVFHNKKNIKGASVSAVFDMEFLFIALKRGYKIKEVPVSWRHMDTRRVRFFKAALETLRDIAKMKYYEITGRYNFK